MNNLFHLLIILIIIFVIIYYLIYISKYELFSTEFDDIFKYSANTSLELKIISNENCPILKPLFDNISSAQKGQSRLNNVFYNFINKVNSTFYNVDCFVFLPNKKEEQKIINIKTAQNTILEYPVIEFIKGSDTLRYPLYDTKDYGLKNDYSMNDILNFINLGFHINSTYLIPHKENTFNDITNNYTYISIIK